jgi:hypothetical protein
MDSKDKYQLFKDIYLELLGCELKNWCTEPKNDEYSYCASIAEIDIKKLHGIVFSRAFTLTTYVIHEAKETNIIS